MHGETVKATSTGLGRFVFSIAFYGSMSSLVLVSHKLDCWLCVCLCLLPAPQIYGVVVPPWRFCEALFSFC